MEKKNIEKFGGENYNMWWIKLKAWLTTKKLWEAVSTKKEEYVDIQHKKGSKMEARELLEAWITAQERVLSYMQLFVTDAILVKISEAQTATEAIDLLDRQFSSKSGLNKLLLKQRLYSIKLGENDDVDTFLSEVEQILQQLASIECKIEGEDAALALLLGLPATWASFKTSICIQNEGKEIVLESVKAAIRTESLTRKIAGNEAGGERAFLTHLQPWMTFCTKCKRTGHTEDRCLTKCYNCGKIGHTKKYCKEEDTSKGPEAKKGVKFAF